MLKILSQIMPSNYSGITTTPHQSTAKAPQTEAQHATNKQTKILISN
jgi:hypothetical protein